MKILIVGGAGFVGANLLRKLLEQSETHEITILDSLDPKLKATKEHIAPYLSQINFIEGDMRKPEDLATCVLGKDIIYVCAGQTSHPLSLKDPLFDTEINCLGNIQLLESVKKLNPRCLVVYISTSTVIGRAQKEIIDEVSKLLDESKLTVIAKYEGTPVKAMQELRKNGKENQTSLKVIKTVL